MNRAAKLDGSFDSQYSPVKFIRDPRGVTAGEMLEMRKTGMTNSAIARAINSKAIYVESLIGRTPPEIVRKAQSEGGKKAKGTTRNDEKAQLKTTHSEADIAKRCGGLKARVTEVTLEGDLCDYHVKRVVGLIDISPHDERGPRGSIALDQVEAFIEELINVTGAIDKDTV